MNFVSIDFETANEKRHSPCAVGLVVANENQIIDEFYSLINPLTDFRSFNTYIHGITEEDVEDAPTFAELWPTLHTYLADHLVVAHNASFDMSVIRNTLDYFKLPYPSMDYLCTVKIAQQIWPELDNHKLNTLALHHEIDFEHHHALEDARVAAKVFMKAIEEYQSESMENFLNVCHLTKGKIYERGYTPPKTRKLGSHKAFR
ncbi:3'-5' exonuclease [Oceanobacillus saliphilus]|uniref:3'-5' exonuclease n=1 Tax=Oceanobacillus saliphilus TaxID=2925834 RepID=UPI00201E2B2C|nr:3'-5' exonuclease [Oceanobacillus saliphilus]